MSGDEIVSGLPDLSGVSLEELRDMDTPELREATDRVVAQVLEGDDAGGC